MLEAEENVEDAKEDEFPVVEVEVEVEVEVAVTAMSRTHTSRSKMAVRNTLAGDIACEDEGSVAAEEPVPCAIDDVVPFTGLEYAL